MLLEILKLYVWLTLYWIALPRRVLGDLGDENKRPLKLHANDVCPGERSGAFSKFSGSLSRHFFGDLRATRKSSIFSFCFHSIIISKHSGFRSRSPFVKSSEVAVNSTSILQIRELRFKEVKEHA